MKFKKISDLKNKTSIQDQQKRSLKKSQTDAGEETVIGDKPGVDTPKKIEPHGAAENPQETNKPQEKTNPKQAKQLQGVNKEREIKAKEKLRKRNIKTAVAAAKPVSFEEGKDWVLLYKFINNSSRDVPLIGKLWGFFCVVHTNCF